MYLFSILITIYPFAIIPQTSLRSLFVQSPHRWLFYQFINQSQSTMVKIKSPNKNSFASQFKLTTHFLILAFITCILCGTGLFVLMQNSEVRTYGRKNGRGGQMESLADSKYNFCYCPLNRSSYRCALLISQTSYILIILSLHQPKTILFHPFRLFGRRRRCW